MSPTEKPIDPLFMATSQELNMSDVFDGENDPPRPESTLEYLRELAAEMVALQAEVDADTAALAEKNAKLDKIASRLIPDVMDELALESFTLKDGSKMEVKPDIKTSITADNKPAAFKWLADRHYDGIIKTKVMTEFGKGEMDKAQKAQQALEQLGFFASLDQSIHNATLKSFVKERLANGEAIPTDLFGIFDMRKTKITKPRK